MSLVANERVKLTATLLNTAAGFSLTAGGLGPLVALPYGITAAPTLGPAALVTIIVVWLAIGLGLHLIARYLLGRLAP